MDAFFEPAGKQFRPRPHARSPWSAGMLHGRLLAGLAARALGDGGGRQLARLTVDLWRAAPMEPVTVETQVLRDGRRVRVETVGIVCAGHEVARATALLVQRGPAPDGVVWSAAPWEAPRPESLPAPVRTTDMVGNPDLRTIGLGFEGAGARRAWLRDDRSLVDGEPLGAWPRAAMAADVANPLANWGTHGLDYINADLSLSMVRDPAGPWIGLEITDHLDRDGVAVGVAALHDAEGRFGHCSVSSVVTPRFAV